MEELLKFLRPEVVSAMALAPVLLAAVSKRLPKVAVTHPGVLNFLIVAGITAWTLRGQLSPFGWEALALYLAQIVVAWLLSDVWFRLAVAPVQNSKNPMLPGGPHA